MVAVQYTELNVPRWPFLLVILVSISGIISIVQQTTFTVTDYVTFAICLGLIWWAIISIKRCKIIIDNEGFTHRKIFKQTFIQWEEIKSADIVIEGGHAGIAFVLKFERWNKKDYRMYFLYGRKKLELLAQAVILKCDTAYISDRVKKLADNKQLFFI